MEFLLTKFLHQKLCIMFYAINGRDNIHELLNFAPEEVVNLSVDYYPTDQELASVTQSFIDMMQDYGLTADILKESGDVFFSVIAENTQIELVCVFNIIYYHFLWIYITYLVFINSCFNINHSEEEFSASAFNEMGNSDDNIYKQALNIVRNERKTSISYIQRSLRIGYNRAANIIEEMEKNGILSAPNHSGKREVLLPED